MIKIAMSGLKKLDLFLPLLALLLLFQSSLTAQLVGTGHSGPNGLSTFYSINASTGAATPIGPIGFERCGSLAVHPTTGAIYSICERTDGSNTEVLITIDRASGVGTEVGVTGGHSFGDAYADLSFRSDGVLFAYLEGNDGVGTIDVSTGTITELGPAIVQGCCGNGIAFNNADILYHANEIELNTINQTTGLASLRVLLNYPFNTNFNRISGMSFDRASGILFGILKSQDGANNTTYLASIDPITGTVTALGQTVTNMDSIAVLSDFIPTMSQWSLFILGLLLSSLAIVSVARMKPITA